MKMTRVGIICGILMFLTGSLWAADGTITGISVSPASPKVNKPIEVTVYGTITPGKKCEILFLKGDGTPQSLMGHATSFPFKFGGQGLLFAYEKPGTYTIKVFCGDNNCTGQAQAVIKVTATIQSIKPGGAIPLGLNPCPQGWHKKSGAANSSFTCVPNKPAQKIQCPPGTEYFETECAVGCQGVIN